MKIIRCSWFPPKGYSAIVLVWWLIVKPNAVIAANGYLSERRRFAWIHYLKLK